MKKGVLLICWVVIVLIWLPGCGATQRNTKIQDVPIQPKTAYPGPKQSATASLSKRGISVVAKTPKGKTQKLQLYDYTAALIIGIDRYENLDASEQLTYAVKDAKGVENVLRGGFQFDEIVTLYNEQATRDKIMQVLYGFRSLTPDGGVFVYFAGHGITISGTYGGKDLGYLIPYNGSLNPSEMYKNISMQQVKSDICVSISAKHVFFVFDACFAGLMLDTRATLCKPSRDFSYLKAITDEQVRQVLTAGAKGETVLDGGPGGHSVFTGRLIQALENTEEYITARELGQYLEKQVYADAAARGHIQRPVDGEIYGTGDFVFVPDLEKKSKDISAEVDALQSELARLRRLKEEAARSRNQAKEREIDSQKLIKDAELKQAQIRKEQKEEAMKHQRQAALEVEQFEKDRKQREAENKQRLAMLRIQADKMRQELRQDLAAGGTVETAVAELKKIKKQWDKILIEFSTELESQIQGQHTFYEKKLSRIMHIPPWDKEFETEENYRARVVVAEKKAAPLREEKRERLASLRHALETVRDDELKPLDIKAEALEAKRFTVPLSQVSFKFVKYYLKLQMMLGILSANGQTEQFLLKIEPSRAREYKHHPELLVPEVLMKATLDGPEFDKVIFKCPGNNETHTPIPFLNISEDRRFVTFASGDEIDTKKGIKIVRDGAYVAYPNGIVLDTETNLEWYVGNFWNSKDWVETKSWVQSLNLDGPGWRMPTIDELAGLYKKGAGSRNMTPLLENTGWRVWSGDFWRKRTSSNRLYFNFYDGSRKDGSPAAVRFTRSPFAVRSRSD